VGGGMTPEEHVLQAIAQWNKRRVAQILSGLDSRLGDMGLLVEDLLVGMRVYGGAVRAEEREACATVVERWHEPPWHCNTCGGEEIAAAIRARGEA